MFNINENSNTLFQQFSKSDLNQLITYLNNYFLEYRKYLNISKNIPFGIEIELIQYKSHAINDYLSLEELIHQNTQAEEYTCVDDSSLSTGGFEVQSPIMYNNNYTWETLKQVLAFLPTIGYIDHTCGGHIHIGTPTLTNNLSTWRNFFLLWSTYEKLIIRFLDGEYLQHRDIGFNTDTPISQEMWLVYELTKNNQTNPLDAINLLCNTRYQAVNFRNITNLTNHQNGNTIEFRNPNGTLNPIIWQNNINLLLNILRYCNSPNFNEEIILKRRHSFINYANEWSFDYSKIYLEEALEFCDLIFNCNLDKLYFLRQYLKNFKTNFSFELTKAPSFTTYQKIKRNDLHD